MISAGLSAAAGAVVHDAVDVRSGHRGAAGGAAVERLLQRHQPLPADAFAQRGARLFLMKRVPRGPSAGALRGPRGTLPQAAFAPLPAAPRARLYPVETQRPLGVRGAPAAARISAQAARPPLGHQGHPRHPQGQHQPPGQGHRPPLLQPQVQDKASGAGAASAQGLARAPRHVAPLRAHLVRHQKTENWTSTLSLKTV